MVPPTSPARHRYDWLVILLVALVVTTAACAGDDEGQTAELGTAPSPSAEVEDEDGVEDDDGAAVGQASTSIEAAESEAPNDSADDTATGAPTSTTTTATATAVSQFEQLSGHYVPDVISTHPHDVEMFTQGLEWYDGRLLESGGGFGESSLALVDHVTGAADWRVDLADDELFAEGLTVVDDTVLQLSWLSGTLLVTDLDGDDGSAGGDGPGRTEFRTDAYNGEGWGLCLDGDRLVMSDGSSRLTFRDPETFAPVGSVEVNLNDQPVERLNELECVGSQVWANVWQLDTIVVIDPQTGNVDATIDASSLVPDGYQGRTNDVLNGIAHNRDRDTIWLTGKRWPTLYEVQLIAAP